MHDLRRLALAHRNIVSLICACILALKLLVPTGYMVSNENDRVEITICSGVSPSNEHMDMPGMPDEMADPGQSKEHGKMDTPCAFSGLSMPALDAVDPLLLFAAIRFAMTVGLRPLRSLVRPLTPYLRPHSHGPPPLL